MKNFLRLVGLIAFMAVLPRAQAADVTGTWAGAFSFQGSSVPVTLHLQATDIAVSGTVEGLPTTPVEIHDGKIDGGAVSFWVRTEYEGSTYKLVFKGKIAEGQIEFSLGTDDGSWGTDLTAKKTDAPGAKPTASDVSGNWEGAFDFQGTSVALTLHLTAAGATVNGAIEGLPTTPAEIHDGKVEGDTVTFWVNSEYEGNSYKLVYKGKVSADGIKFTFGTEDGSWGSELLAKKS